MKEFYQQLRDKNKISQLIKTSHVQTIPVRKRLVILGMYCEIKSKDLVCCDPNKEK